MADKPAAVDKPSVPVSTGRLIPWSTEEDELLRQVRLRLARRAWPRAQPYKRPSATGAAGHTAAAAAPASAPCLRASQPRAGTRRLPRRTAGADVRRCRAGSTVGRAARVQKVGAHRLQDAQQGLQAVPAAVAKLPEQRGREAGRVERRGGTRTLKAPTQPLAKRTPAPALRPRAAWRAHRASRCGAACAARCASPPGALEGARRTTDRARARPRALRTLCCWRGTPSSATAGRRSPRW